MEKFSNFFENRGSVPIKRWLVCKKIIRGSHARYS